MRVPLIAPVALSLVLGLGGCSSSRTVSMDSVEPAELGLAADVRTILIVDRAQASQAGRTREAVEGVLTGELPGEDRAGLQAMIEVMRDQLASSGRFDVRVAREALPGGGSGSAFPTALAWEDAQSLLSQYGADALLSVEVYDSDFVVTKGRRLEEPRAAGTETKRSETAAAPEYFAQGVAHLTIGIRLYDRHRRAILDEAHFRRTHTWEATGSSIRDAVLALIDKSEAAGQVSRGVGEEYAAKISPMPIRISRSFYGKSKRVPAMEQGGRHADMADWREAIRIWASAVDEAPGKEAGQLCYNIAIAHEVLGEWRDARQWARRAYIEFGNREARDYVGQLDRRVQREEVAAQQME